MLQRKLGTKHAEMVLKVFNTNPQHFGFIQLNPVELAELESLPTLDTRCVPRDVFTFRAGNWVVLIVSHTDWVEVTLLNPYDVNQHFTKISD